MSKSKSKFHSSAELKWKNSLKNELLNSSANPIRLKKDALTTKLVKIPIHQFNIFNHYLPVLWVKTFQYLSANELLAYCTSVNTGFYKLLTKDYHAYNSTLTLYKKSDLHPENLNDCGLFSNIAMFKWIEEIVLNLYPRSLSDSFSFQLGGFRQLLTTHHRYCKVRKLVLLCHNSLPMRDVLNDILYHKVFSLCPYYCNQDSNACSHDCFPYSLQSLIIKGVDMDVVDDSKLVNILNSLPNLTEFELNSEHFNLDDEGFGNLTSTKLTKLTLISEMETNRLFSDEIIEKMALNLPNLTYLHINDEITNLASIIHFTKLSYLRLNRPRYVVVSRFGKLIQKGYDKQVKIDMEQLNKLQFYFRNNMNLTWLDLYCLPWKGLEILKLRHLKHLGILFTTCTKYNMFGLTDPDNIANNTKNNNKNNDNHKSNSVKTSNHETSIDEDRVKLRKRIHRKNKNDFQEEVKVDGFHSIHKYKHNNNNNLNASSSSDNINNINNNNNKHEESKLLSENKLDSNSILEMKNELLDSNNNNHNELGSLALISLNLWNSKSLQLTESTISEQNKIKQILDQVQYLTLGLEFPISVNNLNFNSLIYLRVPILNLKFIQAVGAYVNHKANNNNNNNNINNGSSSNSSKKKSYSSMSSLYSNLSSTLPLRALCGSVIDTNLKEDEFQELDSLFPNLIGFDSDKLGDKYWEDNHPLFIEQRRLTAKTIYTQHTEMIQSEYWHSPIRCFKSKLIKRQFFQAFEDGI